MNSHLQLIYLLAVGVLGASFIWWCKRKIFLTEAKRKARIKKIKRFNAVDTSSPTDTPEADAKEAALESVENRFSIIRKVSFISIVFMWLIALLYPFLSGVPSAFVSVLVAASGVIVGLAARPFIENLISGIVLSFSNLSRIGDTVLIDDKYGTIEDITMTHTVLKIWNWRRYIVPNSKMLSKEVINCTINDSYQWSHVEFSVSYDSDLELVKNLAVSAASGSKYFADYEEPKFWIMDMEERGFKCWVAAWTDSPGDAWELKNDIRTELITQFKAQGIKAHKLEFDLQKVGA